MWIGIGRYEGGSKEISSSLPLLPGPLYLGEVIPFRVPLLDQIHLFKIYQSVIRILETI